MQKEISLTLVIVFGTASLSLLTAIPAKPSRVEVRMEDSVAYKRELLQGPVYKLRVAERSRYDLSKDSLSWRIVGQFTGISEFFLNNTIKEHPFTDTGRYVVTAYRNMVEIARDTLLVVDGEGIVALWPEHLTDTVGAEFSFGDASRRTVNTRWAIQLGDSIVDSSSLKDFTWTAKAPGEYTANLSVETILGRLLRDSALLTVEVPPPPVKLADNPPPPKPSPAPWRPKPKQDVHPPAGASTQAFPYIADDLLPNYIYVPTEPPDRNQTTLKSQSTRFEIIPKANCRLHKISYFASSDIGKVQVRIECTSPNATGDKTLVRDFVAGYDAYKPHTHEFKNMPVLNKNYKYRMTITPLQGRLGFYPVQTNKFREKRQDGRAVMANPTSIKLLDEETCVYNLVFRSE